MWLREGGGKEGVCKGEEGVKGLTNFLLPPPHPLFSPGALHIVKKGDCSKPLTTLVERFSEKMLCDATVGLRKFILTDFSTLSPYCFNITVNGRFQNNG